jgi:ABC-type lipoprotein release transport system permease subunit
MIWRISWRNIWRNKVRSLTVMMAIAIGLTGGIFLTGLMNGMSAQQTDDAISVEISHVQIHHPLFVDNLSAQFLIEDVAGKLEIIRKDERVIAFCYRTKAQAIASTAATGAGIIISGIVPEMEKEVTTIYSKIVEGSYFEKENKAASIVIGQKLAHKLKAGLGNKIVVTLQSLNGEMSYALFRVGGIYKTSNSRFDEMNVFVKSDDLNPVLGIDPSQTNEIAMLTASHEAAIPVAASLKSSFDRLSVENWLELRPLLVVISAMTDQFGFWLIVIILLALIFGIINTMLMVILERKHELGMLMAIGMNKKRVFKMILLETTMLSLSGGVAGLFISITLMGIFGNTGINFAAWAEGLEAIGYSSFVYPFVSARFYLIITILVIVTAIVASLWPTRKALKLNPAEAVRSE